MQSVLVNGKYPILLPEHRAARPEWHTPPFWEARRIDSLLEHLRLDDVFYYVGAEEGDIAGLCAQRCNTVALFEPNERVWSNIRAIWEANNLKTPLCFSGFASSKTTNSKGLSKDWPQSAYAPIITDHGFRELHEPSNIPQTRIDDLLPKPSAITLDVEGSEWEVLKGAEETLRQFHPKLWISVHPEFMFRIYGQYQYELRKWIKDLGYHEEILDYQHELHIYYE